MPYIPPRQLNESTVAFFLRAIIPFRYESVTQFEEESKCAFGDEPHRLRVREETSNPLKFGEQYFECRNDMCTGTHLPPPQRLEADERDLIVRLHSLFRRYTLAEENHRRTIEEENMDCSIPHHDPNSCLMYWLSYMLYIHRKSEFDEAFDNAEDQLARYFQRRNGVAMTRADWRIIETAVTLAQLPDFKAHSVVNESQSETGASDAELPPRLKRHSADEPASNKSSPAKRQRIDLISKALAETASPSRSQGTTSVSSEAGPSTPRRVASTSTATTPARGTRASTRGTRSHPNSTPRRVSTKKEVSRKKGTETINISD
ncbi:hypothetical protein PM082_015259 [Marasmius tenuissimus]|nr:hypothetical protein PM082_015259 [Marasmius tenuissimus]